VGINQIIPVNRNVRPNTSKKDTRRRVFPKRRQRVGPGLQSIRPAAAERRVVRDVGRRKTNLPQRRAVAKAALHPRERRNPDNPMTTEKQKEAAKKNIKKAASAAKKKKTISHLPSKTRTALGKEGAKAAKKR